MKYICIDGTKLSSRKEARSYCKSKRFGKPLKDNYIQLPETSQDDDSIKKGYSPNPNMEVLRAKDNKSWTDYFKQVYSPKLKRYKANGII